MELIDIIKSSVLLFSLALVAIIIISFGLFKFRNQAKKKRLTGMEESGRKFLPDSTTQGKKLKVKEDETKLKESQFSSTEVKNKERFVIVNEKPKFPSVQGFRVNYHPNVYKFYEEINSGKMFKIKPEISNQH
jgi:hypothetical protein